MALSNFYVLISILPVYHTNIIYQATAVMQPYFEGFWGLRLKVQSWIIFFIFFFYLLTLTFLFFFSIIILLHKNLIQPQQCYGKWEKVSCISIIYAQNIYYIYTMRETMNIPNLEDNYWKSGVAKRDMVCVAIRVYAREYDMLYWSPTLYHFQPNVLFWGFECTLTKTK